MSNPIPQFHVPDTRPGYAFQDPGAGGAVAGGIQAVLQALLQRQKQEQAQAEFQLEQQRAAQNASYQNTLLAQEQARQDAARQAALAQAMGDQQVGAAVQSIGQPSTVNVQLPHNLGGGATLPMPVGPQVTPDQAMRSLNPSLVVPFEAAAKRQITDYQKGQDEAKATRQKAATETAIRGVLPGLKPMFKKVDELLAANPEADPTAVREAVVAAYGSQPDPAVLAAIDKQHPEWSHLPGAERVKLAFNYEDEKIKARFRPPPAAGAAGSGAKPKPIPASMKKAYQENEQTIRDLNDFITRLGGDPASEDPSADQPVNPGGAFGVVNAIPFLNNAWGTYRKDVKKDKVFAEMATRVSQIRVRPLFNNAGKAVTGNEKAELNPMLNNLSGPPDQQIQNARLLRQWLRRSNEGMQAGYGEGYEPFGSTLTDPGQTLRETLEKNVPGLVKRPQ